MHKRIMGFLLACMLMLGATRAFSVSITIHETAESTLTVNQTSALGCIQPCHRVALTKEDTTLSDRSVIRLWTARTALTHVDEELSALTAGIAARLTPMLHQEAQKGDAARLEISIRYSRTGKTWLSFLVQARLTRRRTLVYQEAASCVYHMITGEAITLRDIFDDSSPGWDALVAAVNTQVSAYFPARQPDPTALESLSSRKGLADVPFTLHGMSLVLHLPAHELYPGRHTLMEITLMYPAIRPFMTEAAQRETDNLAYYKTCALTFDDGPSRTNTSLTLNALKRYGVRGTFFVVGNRIAEDDDIVQREHDEGHAIGAHNWHHGNVKNSSYETLRGMVARVDDELTNAVGVKSRYNRVPYGLYPRMIKAKTGWPLIQWSLDTYDWRGRSPERVLSTVKKQISDGDIILCHDIEANTPQAVSLILGWLEDNGYMPLTIDELFAKDGVALQSDTVYYRCAGGVTSRKKQD